MAQENTSQEAPTQGSRQRSGEGTTSKAASGGRKSRKSKSNNATSRQTEELQAQLARVQGMSVTTPAFSSPLMSQYIAQLAEAQAAQKKLEERAARGSAPAADQEEIQRIERPKGEAGDRKNGFVLQDAMGLEDKREEYDEMLVSAISGSVFVRSAH